MNKHNQFHSLLPKIVILLLILLSILPLNIINLSVIFPMLEAICIYYWSLYRPRMMPYWFVFLIGISWDALYGLPLGVTALGCIGLRFLVSFYQEQLGLNHFSYFWRVTALSLALYAIYKWLALSILYDEILPKQIAILQWAMTVAIYPLLHGFFNMVCHYIPERRGDA